MRGVGMPEPLIVWGGWNGHEPAIRIGIVRGMIEEEGSQVRVANTTVAFAAPARPRQSPA